MDISGMRHEYNTRINLLLEENLQSKDPFVIFDQWFNEAKKCDKIIEPNAMCLATANKNSVPSARFVLCKGYGNKGFKFFTHYTSRKGQELEENPQAALTFYWAPFSRSVRIEGVIEKLPFSEADEYFNARPYQSQIGALCSDQSKPIEGRHVLANLEKELRAKYKEGEVPRPKMWGGYLLVPKSIEFWQGQNDRIHDRIKFIKPINNEVTGEKYLHEGENGWYYHRLAP
ncbi:pyridoxine-5'-phosphate oxidase isoform X3 [Agrilus planipennis]|nr:pyridoxine-5'-phosphate oxidase isoform X3 [Agrilus planipennis]